MAVTASPSSGIRSVLESVRHMVSELLYERRYGVRTSGRTMVAGHDAQNIAYVPMNWRQFRWALPKSSVSDIDVFLDIGSGKGRAVLVAAVNYPFERVIGVEFIKEFHEVAVQNMAAAARRIRAGNVELVCADVREYQIPDDVTVVFMNNPVRGSIFAAVLGAISESMQRNRRPLRLIYHNPVEDEALLATGEWRRTHKIVFRRQRTHWPFGATCVYEWTGRARAVAGSVADRCGQRADI